jgi:hypothetical protein
MSYSASRLLSPGKHPFRDVFSLTDVPGRSFKVVIDDKQTAVMLQPTVVAPSNIPSLRRAARFENGLFSQGCRAGDWVAVFLGPVENWAFADKLWGKGYGTHLQRIGKRGIMNGIVHCPSHTMPDTEPVRWTLPDFVEIGGVGNMINDFKGSAAGAPNCEALELLTVGLQLPSAVTGEWFSVNAAVFFRATRDIGEGEELLRDMGPAHRQQCIETGLHRHGVYPLGAYPVREVYAAD